MPYQSDVFPLRLLRNDAESNFISLEKSCPVSINGISISPDSTTSVVSMSTCPRTVLLMSNSFDVLRETEDISGIGHSVMCCKMGLYLGNVSVNY